MKTSTVLKKAKKYLAKNSDDRRFTCKENFICYSITEASLSNSVSDKDSDRVQTMVQSRLAPCATLEMWLQKTHGIPIVGYSAGYTKSNEYCDKVQATRHAWIDSMIAEFEAKGD